MPEKRPKSAEGEEARHGIQVLRRAVAILRTLAGRGEDGLSLGAIAQRTGLPRSTVQRIIDGLQEDGLVVPSPAGSGSCLGPAIAELAVGLSVQPIDRLRAEARTIVAALDESVAICMLEDRRVAIVETFPSRQPLQVVLSPTITHLGLFTSAAGRALLSTLEPALARKLIANAPDEKTRARIEQDVAATQDDGYASEDGETFSGVSAIALPYPLGGKPYALVLVAPSERFRAERDSLIASFRQYGLARRRMTFQGE